MTYRFYGWEGAGIRDSRGLTPRDYYDLLTTLWAADTCTPRMRPDWSPENPTLGQCSVTAFVMQDLYGGRVLGVPLGDGNFHCFNAVGDCVFDLTSEQFEGRALDYGDRPEQLRSVHLAKPEKRARYELLRSRLMEKLPPATKAPGRRFEGRTCVVTGGGHGIGRAIARAFEEEGARVHVVDIAPGPWFEGDIADPGTLERFADFVIAESGGVDCLVNNAPPPMMGIDDCGWEDFNRALAVGVSAPFYLTKLLMPCFRPGAAVVNLSSTRDRMSQPQTESYAAAKGGIAALTHALAVSLAGRARVNSISPGWIDTTGADITGPDAEQQPVGRVGTPEDIAALALFLCSEEAGFITGENICADGGMTRLMIYHAEHGWQYR